MRGVTLLYGAVFALMAASGKYIFYFMILFNLLVTVFLNYGALYKEHMVEMFTQYVQLSKGLFLLRCLYCA